MIPATILPKLQKLLPMLSSDQDGEVVATVAAIGRLLKSADSDWHALAAAIGDQKPTTPFVWQRSSAEPAQPQRTYRPPPPPKPRPFSFGDLGAGSIRKYIKLLLPMAMGADHERLQKIYERVYVAPHEHLSTSEIRFMNKLWRQCGGHSHAA